eukprot:jgi/Galph1/3876/GphlegSOOS_G2561.1
MFIIHWLPISNVEAVESLVMYKNQVKEAKDELEISVALIQDNRYEDFRIQMRSPPLSNLRKSCTRLYMKATTVGSQERKQIETKYHNLIRALEKADVLALQTQRNSNKENQNKQVLLDSLQISIAELSQFIQLIDSF